MPSISGKDGEGAAIFWSIYDDRIKFALTVRAEEGWVGFGISEAGGMRGADMALYQSSKPAEIVDAYVIADRSTPLVDDCQDWKLEGAPVNEGGWMIVEFSRLLDTKDGQDHAIKNDAEPNHAPARVIAAWGDGETISYHGQNKARTSLRLYASQTEEDDGLTEMEVLMNTLEQQSDGFIDVLEDDFEVPAITTYYHNVCKTFEELNVELPEGQDMVTMIGGVPIITEETRQFVHHFLVHSQKDCSGDDMSLFTRSLIYAWAPGDEGWALPDDVGMSIFDNANNQAVNIEIHYNNPSKISGKKDSSGFRLYFANEKRTHEAGMLEVGDPQLALNDEDIEDGLTKYSFTCPGACSAFYLGGKKERSGGESSQGVTIISEFLHMHQTGVRMTNEVYRDEEVFHTATSDVYDFDQQGNFEVPQDSYQVMPGDSFRTTCYYNDGTRFGLGSKQEMCIAFMMYYPKMEHPTYNTAWMCPHLPWFSDGSGCDTKLELTKLSGVEGLERKFGVSSSQCAAEPSVKDDNIFDTNDSEINDPTTTPPKEKPTDSQAIDPPETKDTLEEDSTDSQISKPTTGTPQEDPIIPDLTPEENPGFEVNAGWIRKSSLVPIGSLSVLVMVM